jgi:ergothioneine biosynthesis protein EgtB
MAISKSTAAIGIDRDDVIARYLGTRRQTNRLCEPLSAEDMTVQVAEIASPAKWHLAHTTWFFETFILKRFEENFAPYDPCFPLLFNSYYTTLGDRHPRDRRGLLTRPGVGEVFAFRDTVDERLVRLIERARDDQMVEIANLVRLGLEHERQHQELLLTDLKLLLHANPIQPAYLQAEPAPHADPGPMRWLDVEQGVAEIGRAHACAWDDFAHDNEAPRHRVFIEPCRLASRLVTNAEYLEFIESGGYETQLLWLDDGWSTVQREGWTKPLYWERGEHGWTEFTLYGRRPLEPGAPAAHLSFFEAEAFARWAGARLPTEAEWERIAEPHWDAAAAHGGFLESEAFHPAPDAPGASPASLAGRLWQWTRSAYEPYPGYAPPEGAEGEYNGKFMCGQFVLRGGSCLTPRESVRPTYRNFFYPNARWQFTGVRLARSVP